MTSVAVILTAPEISGGVRYADVRLAPAGHRARARIVDRPGEWYPYAVGDRVRVQILEDDPAAGVHITGLFGSVSPHGGGSDREIHSRDSADVRLVTHGGDVRVLAAGDADADQDAVACIGQLRLDLLSLQQQVDALVWYLNTATNGGGPLATGAGAAVGLWTTVVQAHAFASVRQPAAPDPTHAEVVGGLGATHFLATPEPLP